MLEMIWVGARPRDSTGAGYLARLNIRSQLAARLSVLLVVSRSFDEIGELGL